jgi:uncharacterized protein (AIM24 family)
MSVEWYIKIGEGAGAGTVGPIPASELVQYAAAGKISAETEVRRGEDGPWFPASRVASLFERAAQLRPTVPEDPGAAARPPELPEDSRAGAKRPLAAPFAAGTPEVIDEAESGGFKVEVLAYARLGGAKDHQTAATVFFANQAGIRLKQVRITLRDAEAITEAGALHFMLGQLAMESKIGGMAGLGRAMMNKFVTREAAILPRYRGTGQVYLEPSFSHFLIYRLDNDEVIADKGMFYCGQGTLDVGSAVQKNVSSALFGGEGLFQTRIKGTGICVFESPVPADEVLRIDLKDDTLRVDGNFALMRTGRIEFSVETSTKGLLGTLTSGEGLLQTFRGTGSVWLAPTQDIYQRLQTGGISTLTSAPRSSSTNVST